MRMSVRRRARPSMDIAFRPAWLSPSAFVEQIAYVHLAFELVPQGFAASHRFLWRWLAASCGLDTALHLAPTIFARDFPRKSRFVFLPQVGRMASCPIASAPKHRLLYVGKSAKFSATVGPRSSACSEPVHGQKGSLQAYWTKGRLCPKIRTATSMPTAGVRTTDHLDAKPVGVFAEHGHWYLVFHVQETLIACLMSDKKHAYGWLNRNKPAHIAIELVDGIPAEITSLGLTDEQLKENEQRMSKKLPKRHHAQRGGPANRQFAHQNRRPHPQFGGLRLPGHHVQPK